MAREVGAADMAAVGSSRSAKGEKEESEEDERDEANNKGWMAGCDGRLRDETGPGPVQC